MTEDSRFTNTFNDMQHNWQIQPQNYLANYMGYFNNILKGMGNYNGNAGLGNFNIGNAGLGQFDAGNAGLGQYNGIGDAGLGGYDIGNTGKGSYDIGNAGKGSFNVGNAGLGQFNLQSPDTNNLSMAGLGRYNPSTAGLGGYNSALLNDLTGKVQGELDNPNTAAAMGLIKDQMAGISNQQTQALNDQLAGWGRGSGVAGAKQAALNSALTKNQADQYRQTGMDITNAAKQAALNLENMRSENFNNAKSRALQNEGLNASTFNDAMQRELQNASMQQQNDLARQGLAADVFFKGKANELANKGLAKDSFYQSLANDLANAGLASNNFYQGKQNDIANASLASENYQNAMQRALQNAGLKQEGYYQGKSNELANTGIKADAYQNAMQRALQNAGLASNNFYQGKSNELANANLNQNMWGLYSGLLGGLGDMYRLQGSTDMQAQQMSFDNLAKMLGMVPNGGMLPSDGSGYGSISSGMIGGSGNLNGNSNPAFSPNNWMSFNAPYGYPWQWGQTGGVRQF